MYYINKVILIITAILYLTLYLGLYSQIVLGITQVLSSLILLFYWNRIDKKFRIKLYWYWTIITLYGLLWLLDWGNSGNTFVIVLGIIIAPMSVAIYFFTILNKLKHK